MLKVNYVVHEAYDCSIGQCPSRAGNFKSAWSDATTNQIGLNAPAQVIGVSGKCIYLASMLTITVFTRLTRKLPSKSTPAPYFKRSTDAQNKRDI